MDDDEPPRIEVIGDADEPEGGDAPVPKDRWHTVVRTVAAVVGAVALLWAGSSLAGMRGNLDMQQCRSEVDTTRYALEQLAYESNDVSRSGRPQLARADAERLVEMARGCGLDDYAQTLERLYEEDDEDEDGEDDG